MKLLRIGEQRRRLTAPSTFKTQVRRLFYTSAREDEDRYQAAHLIVRDLLIAIWIRPLLATGVLLVLAVLVEYYCQVDWSFLLTDGEGLTNGEPHGVGSGKNSFFDLNVASNGSVDSESKDDRNHSSTAVVEGSEVSGKPTLTNLRNKAALPSVLLANGAWYCWFRRDRAGSVKVLTNLKAPRDPNCVENEPLMGLSGDQLTNPEIPWVCYDLLT